MVYNVPFLVSFRVRNAIGVFFWFEQTGHEGTVTEQTILMRRFSSGGSKFSFVLVVQSDRLSASLACSVGSSTSYKSIQTPKNTDFFVKIPSTPLVNFYFHNCFNEITTAKLDARRTENIHAKCDNEVTATTINSGTQPGVAQSPPSTQQVGYYNVARKMLWSQCFGCQDRQL
jgi:hypothetical protein